MKSIIIYKIITLLLMGMFVFGCIANKSNNEVEAVPEKQKSSERQVFVREPAVAGQFYERDPHRLKENIMEYLNKAPEVEIPGRILGLMSPHAGYVYSGQTAAYGYRQVMGKKYDTVIVMAPSHHAPFQGVSIIMDGFYKTPLGDVPIDSEMTEQIASYNPDLIRFIPQAHKKEHSLEVQVPFLQTSLKKGWKIVPIVFGNASPNTCKMAASAIAEVFDPKRHLIIASTDMYHGYSYDECVSMDKKSLQLVEKLNIAGLAQNLQEDKSQFCGAGPVMTLMMLTLSRGGAAQILKYINSGDVTGNKTGWIVGYGCAAFYKDNSALLEETEEEETKVSKEAETPQEEKLEFSLTEDDKKILLSIARNALEEKLLRGVNIKVDQDNPLLDKELGLFVTLRSGKEKNLRGCIGHVFAQKKLRDALPELTLASALHDTRFHPVTKNELKDISIEISLLTPMRLIDHYDEIKIPGHGVYVKKGFRSGVFLPQVADETGWDRDTFMAYLCSEKAGLSPDAWKKPGIDIYVFKAIKIEED